MSAYTATYQAGLNIVPFNFGRNTGQDPLPWAPAARETDVFQITEDPVSPTEETEQLDATATADALEPMLEDEWMAREAELIAEAEAAYQRGKSEAIEEFEMQVGEVSNRLATSLEKLTTMAGELQSKFRNEAVTLATNLAKAAVGETAAPSEDALRNVVDRALGLVGDTHAIKVRCHPADVAAIEAHSPLLQKQRPAPFSVHVTADESIERGGCIIEHSSGSVDAQPTVTIDVLTDAVKAELNNYNTVTEATL